MRSFIVIVFLFAVSAKAATPSSCEMVFDRKIYDQFAALGIRAKYVDAMARAQADGQDFVHKTSLALEFAAKAPREFWQAFTAVLPLYDRSRDNFATLYSVLPEILGEQAGSEWIELFKTSAVRSVLKQALLDAADEVVLIDTSIDFVPELVKSILDPKSKITRPPLAAMQKELPWLTPLYEQLLADVKEFGSKKFDTQILRAFISAGKPISLNGVLKSPLFEKAILEHYERFDSDQMIEISVENILRTVVGFINANQVRDAGMRTYLALLIINASSQHLFTGDVKSIYSKRITRSAIERRDAVFASTPKPAPPVPPSPTKVVVTPPPKAPAPQMSRAERKARYEAQKAAAVEGETKKTALVQEKESVVVASQPPESEEYAENDLRRFILKQVPYSQLEADKIYTIPVPTRDGRGIEVLQIVLAKDVVRRINDRKAPVQWADWLGGLKGGFERLGLPLKESTGFAWWVNPASKSRWRILVKREGRVWRLSELYHYH